MLRGRRRTVLLATGFVLAPVFHRVLHRFHVEEEDKD